MKRLLSLLIMLLLTFVIVAPAAAQAPPEVTVEFTNVAQGDVIELAVGESYTFVVNVSADQQFTHAQLGLNQYFPGRSVHAQGIQHINRTTAGTLTLTITGKKSTAQLPDGLAPLNLGVGVRYPGGVVIVEWVDFFVRVP
jgi:hypothetical protein